MITDNDSSQTSHLERRLARRRGDTGEDAGFTLIELMVVLLILAILLAIAIPTFLGVTKSANDRAAQSNLNTALVNAKSIFQQSSQTYAIAGTTGAANVTANGVSLAASLLAAEPSLTYRTGAVTSQGSPAAVSVAVSADGTSAAFAEQAKGTGTCWYVIDNTAAQGTGWTTTGPAAAGTWYGKELNTISGFTCNAAAIPSSPNATWQQSSFPS
jgi:type IV pilus assembly protein PilA